MKKNILTILILVITLNSLLLSIVYGSLIERQYLTFLEQNTEDIITQIKHQFDLFDRIITAIETDIRDSGIKELLSAYHRIEEGYDRPFAVDEGFLKSMTGTTMFDHFYVVDAQGIIVRTTLDADRNLDLFSTGEVMKRLLSRIYGKGEVFSQRLSISNMTGKKRIYFYFSPVGADWILEASVDMDEFISRRYSSEYSELLFHDFFIPPLPGGSFLTAVDIYSKTSISSWSLFEPKKALSDPAILQAITEKGEYVIREGRTITKYIPIQLQGMSATYTFNQNLILELKFDASIFSQMKRITYLISLLIFLLCSFVFSFIASYLLEGRFILPLDRLNIILCQAVEGDYSARMENDTRIPELSSIFGSANQLLERITDREEKLTLQSEALGRSLKEKELLLLEIHHRVKNNLQIMSSLLSLQQATVNDPVIIDALRSSANRISAMAAVHNSLYGSDDYSSVDFEGFIADHLHTIFHSFGYSADRYRLDIAVHSGDLNLRNAIPCALILTELVSNSIKHTAGESDKTLVVSILLEEGSGGYKMTIRDNGAGLPTGFNPANTSSMGLTIVMNLVDQMDGTIDFSSNGGVTVTIAFPYSDA